MRVEGSYARSDGGSSSSHFEVLVRAKFKSPFLMQKNAKNIATEKVGGTGPLSFFALFALVSRAQLGRAGVALIVVAVSEPSGRDDSSIDHDDFGNSISTPFVLPS